MIDRWITKRISAHFEHMPAIALLGPRQVGKTTVAKQFASHQSALYLDLESAADQFKLSAPADFLRQHTDKLIILDEIQRMPNLFTVLRGLIDERRSQGRKTTQFLLLGSASMDLLRQSSESLAGRISYIEMSGFNPLEMNHDANALYQLWLRGGFPDSYLATSDEASMLWLENMIRTYLERDVPQMGFRVPALRLRRLWTMLAHLQGETINLSTIANNLEVDSKTVAHYIDILVDLLLVRRLSPWYSNVKKRLVKSPRFYICDSGILHRLLGISNHDALYANPIMGKSWEGYVVQNIHAVLPSGVETYFYRTSAGAEIDLLIQINAKELWAIEIKYGTSPKIKKGFYQACQDIQASRSYVIYSGEGQFPLSKDVTVIGLKEFMETLQTDLSRNL